MANVPYSPIADVQPGQAPDNYQRIAASPEAFGAGMGRAAQSGGQGIADLGKAAMTINDIYETSVVNDGANKVQEKFRTLLHGDPNVTGPDGNAIPGYLATNGRVAMDGRKPIQDQMDTYIKEVSSGMDGRSKEQFIHTANQYRMSALSQVDRHAQQQSLTWAETVNNATAKNAQSDIAVNALDDEKVNNFTHDLISARVKNLELAGLAANPQILRETIDTANRDALVTRLNAVAINDPIKAKEILDNNKDKAGPLYDEMEARLRVRVDQYTGDQAARNIIAGIAQAPVREPANVPGGEPASYSQIGRKILVAEGTGPDTSGPGGKPSSSAYSGFIKGTWEEIRSKNPSANLPPTPQEATREQLDAAAGLYAEQNAKALEEAGIEPDPSSLRLAHFLGPKGAISVLNADPESPVSLVLSPDAIAANPRALGNKTAAEVIADAGKVMGGAPTAVRAQKADVMATIMSDPSLSQGAKQYALATARTYFEIQNAQRAEQKRAADEQRAAFTSTLEIQVYRGEKSYADVEGAYQNGLITPEKRTQLYRQMDDASAKTQSVMAGISKAQGAFDGGLPLDPKSEGDRKALDNHYQMTADAWKGLPPDEVRNRAISYAGQMGMLPTPLKQVIRGNLRSGSPEAVIMATDTVKQLRNQNPQILNDFSDEDLRLANLIGAYTDDGIPPADAVMRAQESMKMTEAERKTRIASYEMARGTDPKAREASDEAWMKDKLNSMWTTDPMLNPMMRAEWDRVVRDEYIKTGNIDASRQYGLDTINRNWGRTNVGGNFRYMKYAPEKVYGVPRLTPEQNADWMNEQMLEDVGAGAFIDPTNPLTIDRLHLSVDPTRTGPNGSPRYQVSIMGADGILYAVSDKDGMPKSWYPDWERSQTYRKQREDYDKTISALRAKRLGQAPIDNQLVYTGP